MNTTDPHPDDATLFDLIEGVLEPDEAARIEAHLDTCSSCGELVLAAINGSPDRFQPLEQLPEPAAQQMYRALAGAWGERLAVRASAIAPAPEPTSPPVTPAPTYLPAATPRRQLWTRRIMPALAAAAVITLGGVTLQLQRSQPSDSPTAATKATTEASTEATDAPTPPRAATSVSSDSQARTSAPSGDSPNAVVPEPDAGSDSGKLVCVAHVDPSQLLLPQGRVPQRTLQGPLGLYLVCG